MKIRFERVSPNGAHVPKTGGLLLEALLEGSFRPSVSRAAWSGRMWADRLRPARGAEVRADRPPVLSVLVAAGDASGRLLARSLASLRRQSGPQWEICAIVDPRKSASVAGRLERAREQDPRVRVTSVVAGDPGDAHAAALDSSTGTYVSVIRPGDELASSAVEILARETDGGDPPDVLYGDEATLGLLGIPMRYVERPDWSPALLEGCDYVGSGFFLRTERAREAGGFRAGYGRAFAYELLLRAAHGIPATRVRHLPEVLVLRREGGAVPQDPRDARGDDGARRALEEHLARVRPGARVEPVAGRPSLRRVSDPLPSPCRVAVVVPIRDRGDLLRTCMRDVLRVSGPVEVEPVVVDNGSTDAATLRLLDELAADQGVRVLRRPEPFNFSLLCNAGAAASSSDLICFLNNDVEARDAGWLDELARLASIADVGAAGPLLRYPDGRLQHLGIRVDHPLPRLIGDGASDDELRDCAARHVVREVSAVTGGCLVTRREVFDRVGGFDEQLAVAYNDVDYCLRVREVGLRVLWTPFVEMSHELCATRGRAPGPERREQWAAEFARFVGRWGEQMRRDPFAAGLPQTRSKP